MGLVGGGCRAGIYFRGGGGESGLFAKAVHGSRRLTGMLQGVSVDFKLGAERRGSAVVLC